MCVTIEIDKSAHYFRQVINGEIVPAYQFLLGDRLFDVQEMYLEHIQNERSCKLFTFEKKFIYFCFCLSYRILNKVKHVFVKNQLILLLN
jgi:hypothetical protein